MWSEMKWKDVCCSCAVDCSWPVTLFLRTHHALAITLSYCVPFNEVITVHSRLRTASFACVSKILLHKLSELLLFHTNFPHVGGGFPNKNQQNKQIKIFQKYKQIGLQPLDQIMLRYALNEARSYADVWRCDRWMAGLPNDVDGRTLIIAESSPCCSIDYSHSCLQICSWEDT